MPALLRRRELWWPTAWGWALVAAAVAGLLFATGLGARGFLAVSEPARAADGAAARLLVVEGWLTPGELDQALALIRRGGYRQVVTSGGPLNTWPVAYPDFASRARHYLEQQGLPPGISLMSLPTPATAQDRTYASAVWVRDGLRSAGVPAQTLDVFTSGVHARRSRTLYRLAFGPQVTVGVISAEPTEYDLHRWWASSAGAKTVIGEALSVAWTACCFWPAAHGSHEEKWAVPRQGVSR